MARGQYEEAYKKASKEGKVNEVTVSFERFRTQNEVIVGKLIGLQRVHSREGGGTYLQYIIDTDTGTKKISFGAAYDHEMLPILHIGTVYAWKYIGQRDIGKGHKVNEIQSLEIDASEAGELALNYVSENCPEAAEDGRTKD